MIFDGEQAVELAATRPHSRPQPDGHVLGHACLHLLARRLCAADSEEPMPRVSTGDGRALRCIPARCSKFVAEIYEIPAYVRTGTHTQYWLKCTQPSSLARRCTIEAEMSSASIPL